MQFEFKFRRGFCPMLTLGFVRRLLLGVDVLFIFYQYSRFILSSRFPHVLPHLLAFLLDLPQAQVPRPSSHHSRFAQGGLQISRFFKFDSHIIHFFASVEIKVKTSGNCENTFLPLHSLSLTRTFFLITFIIIIRFVFGIVIITIIIGCSTRWSFALFSILEIFLPVIFGR